MVSYANENAEQAWSNLLNHPYKCFFRQKETETVRDRGIHTDRQTVRQTEKGTLTITL